MAASRSGRPRRHSARSTTTSMGGLAGGTRGRTLPRFGLRPIMPVRAAACGSRSRVGAQRAGRKARRDAVGRSAARPPGTRNGCPRDCGNSRKWRSGSSRHRRIHAGSSCRAGLRRPPSGGVDDSRRRLAGYPIGEERATRRVQRTPPTSMQSFTAIGTPWSGPQRHRPGVRSRIVRAPRLFKRRVGGHGNEGAKQRIARRDPLETVLCPRGRRFSPGSGRSHTFAADSATPIFRTLPSASAPGAICFRS